MSSHAASAQSIVLGVARPPKRKHQLPHIYVPARSADDWTQLLADPKKHWRTGYSARTLAHSWQDAPGFPSEVQDAFAFNQYLAGIQLLLALPEHQVPLVGGSRPSQNDIWALARAGADLVWPATGDQEAGTVAAGDADCEAEGRAASGTAAAAEG